MKKFEHILIASDIDGTLLWKSQYINPKNFEKLRYFCENGGHFALSTGRNHKDVFIIAEKLRPYINMPCILCNGSYLFDAETEEILNPYYLDPVPLIEAFKIMQGKYDDVGLRATTKAGFLCPREDTFMLEMLRSSHMEHITVTRPISEFIHEKIFKGVFISQDHQKLLDLMDEFRERYANDFSITLSDKTILEVMPLGVSKKTQFPYLKEIYSNAELWCIGDFHNDVEMLEGADVAVCPENAVEEIKRICSVQVCHCKDGALAEMIDEIEKRIDGVQF